MGGGFVSKKQVSINNGLPPTRQSNSRSREEILEGGNASSCADYPKPTSQGYKILNQNNVYFPLINTEHDKFYMTHSGGFVKSIN